MDEETKLCPVCKEIKIKSDFHKRAARKSGVQSKCKICAIRINHSRKNPPQTTGIKACTKCNLEKCLTEFFAGGYSKDGRSGECKTCSNIRKVAYLHNNLEKRILENCRVRVRCAINKGYKSKRTIELIGCTIEELKNHLESKFEIGMTWENYGEWHIDHIRPCSSFDLTKEDEQKVCFNYMNLQPLWAKDNLRKGSKINA